MRLMKIRKSKLKRLLFIITALLFIVLTLKIIISFTPQTRKKVVLPNVVVHIDLKGSPPKLWYLESLLPKFKELGVNGLLMEYEDMFPYEGKLVNLSAKNCYKEAELKSFLTKAADLNIQIIPLIQTFGHMENALKLSEFQHLRELPMYPDSICPNRPGTQEFIEEIMKQFEEEGSQGNYWHIKGLSSYKVIRFHNKILHLNYIHIGCDEVFHINRCKDCSNMNLSEMKIFYRHIKLVQNIILALSPTTIILIWDDMLRNISPMEWTSIEYMKYVEPVCWDYKSAVTVSNVHLYNYHKKFNNIWIASAFKGADGPTSTIPNLQRRYLNHFSWMKFILDYKFAGESEYFNFNGIILTGWSRYSFMNPACELLPVSIPSLFLNLILLKKFRYGLPIDDNDDFIDDDTVFNRYLKNDSQKYLECLSPFDIENFRNVFCYYNGSELYETLMQYLSLHDTIISRMYAEEDALSSLFYYAKIDKIDVNKAEESLDWCNNTLKLVSQVEKKMIDKMVLYYDMDFINEYVNFKTYEYKQQLDALQVTMKNFTKLRTWERRSTKNITI